MIPRSATRLADDNCRLAELLAQAAATKTTVVAESPEDAS